MVDVDLSENDIASIMTPARSIAMETHDLSHRPFDTKPVDPAPSMPENNPDANSSVLDQAAPPPSHGDLADDPLEHAYVKIAANWGEGLDLALPLRLAPKMKHGYLKRQKFPWPEHFHPLLEELAMLSGLADLETAIVLMEAAMSASEKEACTTWSSIRAEDVRVAIINARELSMDSRAVDQRPRRDTIA
ncbi:hypothetical protein Slin15195_G058580 [Septoria linicola]|uniref:Uncharacterized protein n=1 Tax=Septoria linicola TaxID=215465 RepID=A0A9Q9AQB7_9PEZI|nr:hypothetical protein Slin14017_G074440 [Septoria linicola]USW52539.1 hypothetical protein Slin15195_G058580 [Septoria linicola]